LRQVTELLRELPKAPRGARHLVVELFRDEQDDLPAPALGVRGGFYQGRGSLYRIEPGRLRRLMSLPSR